MISNAVDISDNSILPSNYPVSNIKCKHRYKDDTVDSKLFYGRSASIEKRGQEQFKNCYCSRLFTENESLESLEPLVKKGMIDVNARRVKEIDYYSYTDVDNIKKKYAHVDWSSAAFEGGAITNMKELEWFIDHGLDIDQPVDNFGRTLFHYIVSMRFPCEILNYEEIDIFLRKNPCFDKKDINGDTPMHFVACVGHRPIGYLDSMLKSLDGECLDIIDSVNHKGVTPLGSALKGSYYLGGAVRLLKAGASANKVADENAISPLECMFSGDFASSEALELLIYFGTNIDESCQGKIPYNILFKGFYKFNSNMHGCYTALVRLFQEGFPLNTIDINGESLLSGFLSSKDLADCYYFARDKTTTKLTILAKLIVAWYKYNFPERIDDLEGVITDQFVEKYETDLAKLLENFPDVFYLIDHTTDIIGKNLNDRNKDILHALLEKFRNHHPRHQSMEPFVYCCPEQFNYRPVKLNEEVLCNLQIESYAECGLADTFEVEKNTWIPRQFTPRSASEAMKKVFPIVDEYRDSDGLHKPETIRLSDIKISNWVVKNNPTLLLELFNAQPDLLKAVITNSYVYSQLTEENRNDFVSLLSTINHDQSVELI